MMRRLSRIVLGIALATALGDPRGAAAQSGSVAQPVPVMDGGVGPCSVVLTVLSEDGKPVAAADVKVHIAYGFAGVRKLDLEAGTNVDGKVKFTGLPSKVRRPPLDFQASKGNLSGVATYNPETECEAKHDLTMSAGKASGER